VWSLAGDRSPIHAASAAAPVVIDLDATLVPAHSDKQQAAPTYKRGFGFHPLLAFIDHGPAGTGEAAAGLLRPGNAGANTAADHLTVIREALRQLPFGPRPGRRVLIRTDGAGCTHQVAEWLARRRLQYSMGFRLTAEHAAAIRALPEAAWTPAYDPDGVQRRGAWVAEVTGVLDLSGWPAGMRVLVRAERPHPGAQLRFTDLDGNRLTALATNTPRGQLAELELRHRRRARCEDRIRAAKDTGLTNLPLHDFDQNRIWLAIVMLAGQLTAWLQILALTGTEARTWEPKRLRLRLFSIPGRLARRCRTVHLRLPAHAPWAHLITTAINQLNPAPT